MIKFTKNKFSTVIKEATFTRTFYAGVILTVLIIIYSILQVIYTAVPAIIDHFLLALCALSAIHLLDQALLKHDIERSLDTVLKQSNSIIHAAKACNIIDIYPNRDKATKDVFDAIKNARSEIWLLGISISGSVTLEKLLPVLEKKISKYNTIDVKILLHDHTHSPAVFRTLLKASPADFKNILQVERPCEQFSDPLFDQASFVNFFRVQKTLNRKENDFISDGKNDYVRYYHNSPICWIVRADNTIFYEPYTFGENMSKHSIMNDGDAIFPIIKLKHSDDSVTTNILVDHFKKQWYSSEATPKTIQSTLEGQKMNGAMERIVKQREDWFWHMYEELCSSKKLDYRLNKRTKYENKVTTSVSWNGEDGVLVNSEITFLDYAETGFGINFHKGQYPVNTKSITLHKHNEVKGLKNNVSAQIVYLHNGSGNAGLKITEYHDANMSITKT